MTGHLHLVCSPDKEGRSFLSAQSFRAPLHLSKPHTDEDTLVVNIVNPTAGIFDDDRIEVNVQVKSGARLLLTTPSASRVYRSRSGSAAQMRQQLEVASGGFLEYFPEPFIPHKGARFRQHNDLHVAEGGALLHFEWLAPGRVASGEVFQYCELFWETDLWAGDRLGLRERYGLSPEGDSLESLRQVFPEAHYLSCVAIGVGADPSSVLDAMSGDGLYAGCAPLCTGGWVIKLLCRDALVARHAMRSLREGLHRQQKSVPARLGRF
jgi:urease accessory protein